MPERTERGGKWAAPQHSSVHADRHTAPDRLVRRGPAFLHGELRLHRRGLYLCAIVGKRKKNTEGQAKHEKSSVKKSQHIQKEWT